MNIRKQMVCISEVAFLRWCVDFLMHFEILMFLFWTEEPCAVTGINTRGPRLCVDQKNSGRMRENTLKKMCACSYIGSVAAVMNFPLKFVYFSPLQDQWGELHGPQNFLPGDIKTWSAYLKPRLGNKPTYTTTTSTSLLFLFSFFSCVYHVERVSCLPSYLLKCYEYDVFSYFCFVQFYWAIFSRLPIHSAYACEAAVQNTPAAYV